MKRNYSFILAMVLGLFCFISCDSGGDDDENSVNDNGNVIINPSDTITSLKFSNREYKLSKPALLNFNQTEKAMSMEIVTKDTLSNFWRTHYTATIKFSEIEFSKIKVGDDLCKYASNINITYSQVHTSGNGSRRTYVKFNTDSPKIKVISIDSKTKRIHINFNTTFSGSDGSVLLKGVLPFEYITN